MMTSPGWDDDPLWLGARSAEEVLERYRREVPAHPEAMVELVRSRARLGDTTWHLCGPC